jgi:hypothetical protein
MLKSELTWNVSIGKEFRTGLPRHAAFTYWSSRAKALDTSRFKDSLTSPFLPEGRRWNSQAKGSLPFPGGQCSYHKSQMAFWETCAKHPCSTRRSAQFAFHNFLLFVNSVYKCSALLLWAFFFLVTSPMFMEAKSVWISLLICLPDPAGDPRKMEKNLTSPAIFVWFFTFKLILLI